MKARLIQFEDTFQLLLCTGSIHVLSCAEAYTFLENYDSEDYYSGSEKWDYEGVTMESYSGTTIAVVNDEGVLFVENAELWRMILKNKEIKYITVLEYAEKHGRQEGIVRRLCRNGRIEGVIQKGKAWLIPENSPYPKDERIYRG